MARSALKSAVQRLERRDHGRWVALFRRHEAALERANRGYLRRAAGLQANEHALEILRATGDSLEKRFAAAYKHKILADIVFHRHPERSEADRALDALNAELAAHAPLDQMAQRLRRENPYTYRDLDRGLREVERRLTREARGPYLPEDCSPLAHAVHELLIQIRIQCRSHAAESIDYVNRLHAILERKFAEADDPQVRDDWRRAVERSARSDRDMEQQTFTWTDQDEALLQQATENTGNAGGSGLKNNWTSNTEA